MNLLYRVPGKSSSSMLYPRCVRYCHVWVYSSLLAFLLTPRVRTKAASSTLQVKLRMQWRKFSFLWMGKCLPSVTWDPRRQQLNQLINLVINIVMFSGGLCDFIVHQHESASRRKIFSARQVSPCRMAMSLRNARRKTECVFTSARRFMNERFAMKAQHDPELF